ncbi:MAG TPA: YciI family protein [Chloroflexota bacterium]|nr:YciI family protein [Chloroflexota bacterium]
MRYLLLICGDENRLNNLSESEQTQRHEAWGTYTNELVTADKLRGGERLRPAATATTLRVNGGGRLLSDGPFAETKEQLGGFYVVEASNLDEAVDLASKMPHLQDGGSVEIRPIWDM